MNERHADIPKDANTLPLLVELIAKAHGNEITRVQEQMQGLQATLSKVQADLDSVRATLTDFKPPLSSLTSVETKIDKLNTHVHRVNTQLHRVNKKVPPIVQSGTVLLGLCVALGLTWTNLRDAIRQTAAPINDAASQVQASAKGINSVSESLGVSNKELASLNESQKGNMIRLESFVKKANEDIGTFIKKADESQGKSEEYLANVDQVVARVNLAAKELFSLLSTLSPPGKAQAAPDVARSDDDKLLELAEGIDPSMVPAQIRIGRLVQADMKAHRFESARGKLEASRATASKEEMPWYDYFEADTYYYDRKYDQALPLYKKCCDADKGSVYAMDSMGMCYVEMAIKETNPAKSKQLRANAIEHFQECTRRFPDHVGGFYHLAQELNVDGSYKSALEVLRRAPPEVATEPKVQLEFAKTFALLRQVSPALDALSRAIKADPKQALVAAVSKDFRVLRNNTTFVDLLERTLGKRFVVMLQEHWKKDEQGEQEPGKGSPPTPAKNPGVGGAAQKTQK